MKRNSTFIVLWRNFDINCNLLKYFLKFNSNSWNTDKLFSAPAAALCRYVASLVDTSRGGASWGEGNSMGRSERSFQREHGTTFFNCSLVVFESFENICLSNFDSSQVGWTIHHVQNHQPDYFAGYLLPVVPHLMLLSFCWLLVNITLPNWRLVW